MPRFTVARHGAAIHIRFDDGGMNLLSRDVLRELQQVVVRLSGGRVVTFRSARPHIFAAGADMVEMQQFSPREAEEFARLGQETFAAIERLPSITVALIDGDCFGGALDLVLAFDLRFATARSRFAHPGAKLGIVTGFGGTTRWRKALSRPAARALFLDNALLSAAEAQSIELVDGVMEGWEEEIDRLLKLDPAATRVLKELSWRADRLSQRELQLMAERLVQIYFGSSSS
jgi:enoyl-CoA hydratase